MIFKNKRYSNKYNKNVIKNSVTVYADSIGNTEINREAIWITLVEQYKRSFNSFLIRQRAYIRYVVGIGLFYFGWMWIKIRRRRINRQSARHESKLVKSIFEGAKGKERCECQQRPKIKYHLRLPRTCYCCISPWLLFIDKIPWTSLLNINIINLSDIYYQIVLGNMSFFYDN